MASNMPHWNERHCAHQSTLRGETWRVIDDTVTVAVVIVDAAYAKILLVFHPFQYSLSVQYDTNFHSVIECSFFRLCFLPSDFYQTTIQITMGAFNVVIMFNILNPESWIVNADVSTHSLLFPIPLQCANKWFLMLFNNWSKQKMQFGL